MFSSRCLTDEVPGIGRIALDLLSNQANATCSGVASRSLSDLLYGVMRLLCLAKWSPRKKRNAVLLAVVDDEVGFAVGKAVPVLHRNDRHNPAGSLNVLKGYV